MDEKIKEMAKLIKPIVVSSYLIDRANDEEKQQAFEEVKKQQTRNATALYNAGYRKESDTAREILAEAKKWVKAHYKDKVTDSFGERPMLFLEAFGCLFEYLKEKYIDE